ncbi:ketoacyl-ACP synthase III [Streptomyces cocklensis]|uniref:Beta-ketoacyl-[acyl-carrier-protein] synthase III n=1 Tax=Actinacidiphila cocklensis TaxID=887465 RepID=A0A9W4DQU4_9ACTN|nr:beta-ketoacyl-ACP synthase III [Actinacidiphila cocklensis]MDD1059182.1 ketoacyl-ACP synthase III [Actinacidiphila cocklensis]WSX73307.1 ketoacyl-ACP synthase III [Streptomyces sp. NBC_00899]WSX80627.1 ketoacyl-ACP synthase III [Streptomyces sp. NBC_00899]CAG6394418.1 3-oxoacyl-(acyl-carrier-protein) synthase 3 [Actinacidiphila cocklensis]
MKAEIAVSAGARYTRILGVGAYRPRRVVDNAEVCRHIDSTDEWIRSRTGIVTRRWAGPDETLGVMAEQAASKAIAAAGLTPDAITCVIAATFTHLKQTPAIATEIGHRIGATGAAGFDISAGCAGFVHGIALASDAVRARGGHVLVVGVERMTDILDLTDRSTAFIFGDGAGAVVVGPSETPGIGPVVWGADGSQADAITQSVPWDALRDAPGQPFPALRQDGQRVFRWAVYEMSKVAVQALEAAGITADDLDAFVPHQANERIIDSMTRSMGLPARVAVAKDIVTTGNTSGASIPLAMESLLASGQAATGDTALLLGYGSGLSYAALVATLP